MRNLYLECNMGAAGDMLMGALLDLLPDEAAALFLNKMNHLGLPGVHIQCNRAVKCGITGNQVDVKIHGIGEEELYVDGHILHEHGEMHPHEAAHSHEEMHSHGIPHEHKGVHTVYEAAHSHEEMHSHGIPHEHGERHPHEAAHSHEEMHSHGIPHEHGERHLYEAAHSHDDHSSNDVHSHTHSGMADILSVIASLDVSDQVKKDAGHVYQLIAEAEAAVHGKTMDQIHFHEIGTMDAVADVVGVCLLMEMLAPSRILASPVHVGSGQVHCAHGVLPVPAPATARILRGIPIYGGQSQHATQPFIQGELCTPTGAALLKYFVAEFTGMPVMQLDRIGYGMGHKDFAAANCIRAFWGESGQEAASNQQIVELCCNLDDMTGEAIAYAKEVLFAQGALDVFTAPIQMKKNRPGILFVCICAIEDADRMAASMLKHTTTFGVRKQICERYCMDTTIEPLHTPYGIVHQKTGTGYGAKKSKLEYEDLHVIAKTHNKSLQEIVKEL